MTLKIKNSKLFRPVESKRTFEQIAARIKKLIVKGSLKRGDRLQSEIELARQFRVGRQTIREALRFLELSGFITIKRGSGGGPVITGTVLDFMKDSLLYAVKLQNVTIDEIVSARLEIERGVLRAAVENADESDIEALRNNISKALENVSRGIRASSHNVEFHRLLAKTSKNRVFVVVAEALRAVSVDYLSRAKPDIEQSKMAISYHEALVEAIQERNLEKALELLEEHIRKLGMPHDE
jgi:GntR family transcriptional repressor for pyruvate dehydrogenase complex